MIKLNTHTVLTKALVLTLSLAFTCYALSAQNSRRGSLQGSGPATITIDISKRFQTIDNFSASDAWACQFVGNWPEAKKNAIADLLFSRRILSDGRPEGIGLSMWRFNIGAGSAQQGRESGIRDEWRRAESFLEPGGKFNWDRQGGQMWFLKAAKQRGVQQFLAFTNSPAVQFTRNGKAFADSSKPNLLPERFDAFAQYLATVTTNVHAKTGVLFDYISPVNEPQWDWSDGGQEGTPFNNSDINGIAASLDAALLKNNLKTKIIVTEAGDYKYLYSEADKPGKGNQIETLFSPASILRLTNFKSVENLIAGHSYFTTSPYAKAESIRKKVAAKVASVPGLRFWQSEYCILGDNEGEIKGEKRDLGIDAAIYLAKVIHNDLVNANASAWQWWLAISPYDYKDGLIYVEKNKTDGNFYPSKMLWALGNYSRFIAPGAVRVETLINSGSPDLFVSSYLDKASEKLVTVAINAGNQPHPLVIRQGAAKYQKLQYYVTSDSADLKPGRTTNGIITASARSITTIISDLKNKGSK